MNLINRIKNKSFLFICTDFGSASIINSFIEKENINKFKLFFLSDKTKYIFKKYKKFFLKTNSFLGYDIIIVGTGGYPEKYYNLLESFDSSSSKYFLIDHWLGINRRLNFNLLNQHAVNLLFTEFKNIKKIQSKLKYSKSYKIRNYYMDEVLKNSKIKKKFLYKYLYVDDLSLYIFNEKIRKIVYEDCIKNFLYFLEKHNKKTIKILIRPHPNDKTDVLKKLIKNYKKESKTNLPHVTFYFSNNKKNIFHDLNLCESVVGSQSSVLLLSKKIGKKTYTSLKDSYLRKFAKDSPFFKKIS